MPGTLNPGEDQEIFALKQEQMEAQQLQVSINSFLGTTNNACY
jgi:hypothetical protein